MIDEPKRRQVTKHAQNVVIACDKGAFRGRTLSGLELLRAPNLEAKARLTSITGSGRDRIH